MVAMGLLAIEDALALQVWKDLVAMVLLVV